MGSVRWAVVFATALLSGCLAGGDAWLGLSGAQPMANCNQVVSVSMTPTSDGNILVGESLTITAIWADDGGPVPCSQNMFFRQNGVSPPSGEFVPSGLVAAPNTVQTSVWTPVSTGSFTLSVDVEYDPAGSGGNGPDYTVSSNSITIMVWNEQEAPDDSWSEHSSVAASWTEKAGIAASWAEKSGVAASWTEKPGVAASWTEKSGVAASWSEKAGTAASWTEKPSVAATWSEKASVAASWSEKQATPAPTWSERSGASTNWTEKN